MSEISIAPFEAVTNASLAASDELAKAGNDKTRNQLAIMLAAMAAEGVEGRTAKKILQEGSAIRWDEADYQAALRIAREGHSPWAYGGA